MTDRPTFPDAAPRRRDPRGGRPTAGDRGAVTRALRGAARAALGVAALATGCVTYEVTDAPLAAIELTSVDPVVVPLHGGLAGERGPVDEFYTSVVAQLHAAYAEREPEVLHTLLLTHDRSSAPGWAREQMASYRRLLVGMRIEEHFASHARLRDAAPGQTLGGSVELELVVAPTPIDVELPGPDAACGPATFLFDVEVRDEDAFGNVATRNFRDFVALRAAERPARRGLRLPFQVRPLAAEGLRRGIRVRCELVPGAVLLDGEPVPNRRVPLAELRVTHWPAQVDNVAARPLETLRVALEDGAPDRFRYIYVAAWFVPREQRDSAVDLLVKTLRVAPPPLARVCTVALRSLTGLDIGIGERDAWLVWWQGQRGGG